MGTDSGRELGPGAVVLFEVPWNIAFVPKLFDSFTRHEAKGIWPEKYQERFFNHVSIIYEEFIDEYNQLISDSSISNGLSQYIMILKKQSYSWSF